MHAFQALIHDRTIDLDYMTTHRFDIDHCRDAYELMMSRTEDYLGMLIQYDAAKDHSRQSIDISARNEIKRSTQHGIGFIGAGSYAMSYLLPNLTNNKDTSFTGVVTSTGTSSRSVAEKFGFSSVAASAADVISDNKTSTVFVVTRHDSHANYVREALHAGKNVFVEKPLCLSSHELDGIVEAWQAHKPILMVGFNRRFSPLASRIKETLRDGPMSMIYRVNAGPIPADSWIQDMDVGGGRIIGEVCHFIDFMIYMNGSLPIRVHATALQEPSNLNDTVAINLTFENGSIGSVCYYANGPKSLFKEYIEIYKGQTAARLIDFKEMEIIGDRKTSRKKLISQDKGQKIMVDSFIRACQRNGESPISLSDTFATSTATFGITESLRTNRAVEIVIPVWQF
jgi:polar amino acid transport system substrate-binding protein